MGTGELTAELHQPAVLEGRLNDPAARAVAGLEHHHVRPGGREVAGSRQSGQAGPDDDGVSHGLSPLAVLQVGDARGIDDPGDLERSAGPRALVEETGAAAEQDGDEG